MEVVEDREEQEAMAELVNQVVLAEQYVHQRLALVALVVQVVMEDRVGLEEVALVALPMGSIE